MKKYSINALVLVLVLLGLINARYISDNSKPEFLLVGVMHHIPDSIACNWQDTYQKLLQYKADQIAVEEVMPTDSSSLIQNYGKNYRAAWDSLTLAWEGKKIRAADSIRHYQTLLSQRENPVHRLKLWKYLHLGIDLGNREFQTYRMAQHISRYQTAIDSSAGWGKFFWKSYKRMINDRKNSEFFNLIYPLAINSGIAYLYPTDERITFPFQSEAYGKFAEKLEGTKAMKKLENFWKELTNTEAEQLRQCKGLALVNSKDWLAKTDHAQAHILDDTNNEHYREYSKVWYERNKSIANRVIQAARQSKAKKMAVFYGYMHVYPVKKYLEAQGYKVKLLEDI